MWIVFEHFGHQVWLTFSYFISIGRGVIALTEFHPGDFLLQYGGVVISDKQGNDLENLSSSGFRYFVKFKGEHIWYDYLEFF